MFGSKQTQSGGDASINLQADNITFGLTYSEARQVAMDVFEANFYKLSNIAAQVAHERAGALLDSYLSRIEELELAEVSEAKNPDLQSVFGKYSYT